MCKINIKFRKSTARNGNEYLYVQTPYSTEFVTEAKKLNGSWVGSQKEWAFDPRVEDRVREVCKKVYGTDGLTPVEYVTVRLNLDALGVSKRSTKSLELFGRTIAIRWSRHDYVKLDPTVIVLEGGFPDTGGSAKHPDLSPWSGTILEVRDVPKNIIKLEDFPEGAIEIFEEKDLKPNFDELRKEADALRKRLAEIMEIFAQYKETL